MSGVPKANGYIMISFPMKNCYFIGNIPYFQTQPYIYIYYYIVYIYVDILRVYLYISIQQYLSKCI